MSRNNASPASRRPPELSSSPKKCPVCGKPAMAAHDPFCSKRCAQVDLNRWLSGTYAIPGRKIEDEGEGGT